MDGLMFSFPMLTSPFVYFLIVLHVFGSFLISDSFLVPEWTPSLVRTRLLPGLVRSTISSPLSCLYVSLSRVSSAIQLLHSTP